MKTDLFIFKGACLMYHHLKTILLHLTLDDLESLNEMNDLRIDSFDLALFHHLLTQQWDKVMDDSSLSLNDDYLSKHCNLYHIPKYHELITTIKRNVIFNKQP